MGDFTNLTAYAMLHSSAGRLQGLAQRALTETLLTRDELIFYCIEVDSLWRNVVDALQPGMHWQKVRDRGFAPLAIGGATWEQLKPLTDELPDLFRIQHLPLSEGHVRVIIVNTEGWSAFELSLRESTYLH